MASAAAAMPSAGMPMSRSARGASSASRSVISPSSAFGASNAAAMRRSAADALGALNASTCGSTTACVGAWGKLNMPPSTWQIS
jgi:hypothetical protein